MSSSAVYPALLCLPNGVTARVRIVLARETNKKGDVVFTQIVQRPPIYETADGVALAIDVTIPADLAERWAWHWHGATLTNGHDVLLVSHWGLPGIFDAARRRTPESAPDAAQAVMELV